MRIGHNTLQSHETGLTADAAKKVGAIVAAVAMGAGVLTGCSSATEQTTTAEQKKFIADQGTCYAEHKGVSLENCLSVVAKIKDIDTGNSQNVGSKLVDALDWATKLSDAERDDNITFGSTQARDAIERRTLPYILDLAVKKNRDTDQRVVNWLNTIDDKGEVTREDAQAAVAEAVAQRADATPPSSEAKG